MIGLLFTGGTIAMRKDPATGAAVPNVTNTATVASASHDINAANAQLLRVNPTTGAATLVGATGALFAGTAGGTGVGTYGMAVRQLPVSTCEADISGDGCIVLRRVTAGAETIDEVVYEGIVARRWRFGPTMVIGDADDDGDRAFDWHAEITLGPTEATSMVIDAMHAGSRTGRVNTS